MRRKAEDNIGGGRKFFKGGLDVFALHSFKSKLVTFVEGRPNYRALFKDVSNKEIEKWRRAEVRGETYYKTTYFGNAINDVDEWKLKRSLP